MKTNKDFTVTKNMIEEYSLNNIPGGLGWAVISINNDTGRINIQSDYGDYTYKWGSPGMPFKRFLIKISKDPSYLLGCIASETYYDRDAHKKQCLKALKYDLEEDNMTYSQYEELVDFFENDVDFGNSKETADRMIFSNPTLSQVTGGEPWYNYTIGLDYEPRAVKFVKEVFPIFAEILQQEEDARLRNTEEDEIGEDNEQESEQA